MEDFDIPGVEAAISRLREIQAEVFGADGQGFQINPALPESEAASFERDHKMALPPDHRQFLTDLGDGGAGPFHDVFPLWTTISICALGRIMTVWSVIS